jgi:hypothetical protein
MLGVVTDNANHPSPPNNFAFVTDWLNTNPYFHNSSFFLLQVPGLNASLLCKTIMVMHSQLSLNLTHEIKVNPNQNQQ